MKEDKTRCKNSQCEKTKVLNCLIGVGKLIEQHRDSIDQILQGVVNILPTSWQYPEITCGRVTFKDKEYTTPNFKISQRHLITSIIIGGKKVGAVEVYYRKNLLKIDEDPFFKEEQLLITAVAERISRTIERIKAEQQLKVERAALESKNVALHELVEMVQKEKEYVGVRIQTNVDKIIMPIIYAIENEIPQSQLGYVKLLKKNLKEIASPFTNNISKKYSSLTPVEIQICDLIKNGFKTKDIAKIRGISGATVNRHREHIRKKLGVSNQKINLTTYLNSFIT